MLMATALRQKGEVAHSDTEGGGKEMTKRCFADATVNVHVESMTVIPPLRDQGFLLASLGTSLHTHIKTQTHTHTHKEHNTFS